MRSKIKEIKKTESFELSGATPLVSKITLEVLKDEQCPQLVRKADRAAGALDNSRQYPEGQLSESAKDYDYIRRFALRRWFIDVLARNNQP